MRDKRCIITNGPVKRDIDNTTDDYRADLFEAGMDGQFGGFGEFPLI